MKHSQWFPGNVIKLKHYHACNIDSNQTHIMLKPFMAITILSVKDCPFSNMAGYCVALIQDGDIVSELRILFDELI